MEYPYYTERRTRNTMKCIPESEVETVMGHVLKLRVYNEDLRPTTTTWHTHFLAVLEYSPEKKLILHNLV